MVPVPTSGEAIEDGPITSLSKLTATGLKKVPPYWHPYTTMAKERWQGREILEVVSTEFRDRSMEYYRYALESGVTSINGKAAKPETIIRNGDRIENIVHRHEPPIAATPVKILLHDKEKDFIVIDKPGSIPVHATGRYYKNSLVQILQTEFGFPKVYTVNRLDRLTSGLMIIPLNSKLASQLADEFFSGNIQKEYIARVRGEFPAEEITCEEPLLTVDRQMGLNIVHPEGKPAKTIFNLMHYDQNTDSSVVHCRPFTGRSHQLRVHLQFLGYPIANDPVYSTTRIWGDNLGKGGIDLTPSEERSAPVAPEELQLKPGESPESLQNQTMSSTGDTSVDPDKPKLLPRETGQDIGMGSPVPLSAEAVRVITNLRNLKDQDEDWSRWRDVVFRAKGALTPSHFKPPPLPPQNKRKRGGPVRSVSPATPASTSDQEVASLAPVNPAGAVINVEVGPTTDEKLEVPEEDLQPPQLTTEEALAKLDITETTVSQDQAKMETEQRTDVMHYCPECYLPIHPDPKPERLYIFLHALRYTTKLGRFETGMPEWATPGWEWDRS